MGLFSRHSDENDNLYLSRDGETPQEELKSKNVYYSPSNFSQTRILADKLKAGYTITIDVSNMDKKEAIRMIDFLGGVMYSLDGDMKKIGKSVFEYSIPSLK